MNDKFGWRARKAEGGNTKTVQYDASRVKSVGWVCIGSREFELKVGLDDGEVVRFEGFKAQVLVLRDGRW